MSAPRISLLAAVHLLFFSAVGCDKSEQEDLDPPAAASATDPSTPAPEPAPAPPPPAPPPPKPSPGKVAASQVLAAMDRKADPCTDFYRYACGSWIDQTELPEDKARWTRSFGVLRESNRELMREILEQAGKDASASGERQKLGAFYQACMDEKAVDAAGSEPLTPMLKQIEGIADANALLQWVGKLHTRRARPLFGTWVSPDPKNPGINIAHFYQAGLGLPDRDYYLSPQHKEPRAGYEQHIAKMFVLLGDEPAAAAKDAAAITAFETKLAKLQMTRAERRDPDKTYNKLDLAGLQKKVKQLAWTEYLKSTGHPDIKQINVDSVKYFKGMAKLARKTRPEVLRAYLRWHLLSTSAPHLSAPFVQEDFAFYGKQLRGQKQIEDRWKRCVSAASRAMGQPLGKVYVERTFAGDSKRVALDLIQRIEAAFEANLPKLAWMDDKTRARAVEKMKAIRNKIGYPDKWRDYSGLQVNAKNYFGNVMAARKFEYDYQANKVGKPVDKTEWWAPPTVVNASYSGTRNEMWFPAGILQPPFFHKDQPMAMNFGGIGMVMGHELTHGFDDQGRKFDAKGRLKPWWGKKAIKSFEQRAACVDKLYSSYEIEPGRNVNGKLTLGENIADLGGLKQAFGAYKEWAKNKPDESKPAIEGLTNEQLVFVNFAQIWCSKETQQSLRVRVVTDPHSPSNFRVLGPVSNSPEFAKAFGCTPKPAETKTASMCEVW